jgi:hypothetical protein
VKYIAIGIGVSILVYALFRIFYLRLYGSRTLGTIVGVRKDSSSDSTVFYPIVKFTTDAGVTLELESSFGSSQTNDFFRVGQQVDILYAPKHPKMFSIVGHDSHVLISVVLLLAIIGGVLYWFNTRQ